ncbi:hypothetical protein N7495_003384 [Penicillium taxi]|uniref:uncharacterized protein n=1 Tax=Penicillium taxi TaxID=168475 RepID=UPI0025450D44|nr:uncharacterized protein N7495_003384 [Penicillium taxi]KAJ5902856.1 hypothetical protein N7495_003384 [Penicillium taxi]
MDVPTTLYLLTFVLSVAFIYYLITKGIPSRLIANQAPTSRFELVPVDNYTLPARASGIDIIFVHSLGSNPNTTWRARTSINTPDRTEPRQPNKIRKDARIFFYNYDSYWKRDAVYTRLTSVGNSLLEHINGQIHQSKDERSRHLVFVGHSYGGLVIKEALIQAKRRDDFNHIMEQTKAIFFLGTPHRGSSFGPWGWLVASALQPLGSNPLILANLEYDSVFLSDLYESFIASIHDDLKVCVPETSATYDGRTEELREKLQIRHDNASIPYAVTLHGLGGAGKSQLALKYAESHTDRYNPVLWIDAISEETVRSSFIRCVTNLGLPDEKGNNDSLLLKDDRVIQSVLQWLRDRNERDDEWLAIIDNADDFTWGIKKVMPRGTQGRLIITSRDS